MVHSIRALDNTDRLRWEELFQNYAEFYELDIPGGGLDRVWDWIFDPEHNFWCDLAVDTKGHNVGFVQYQLMHSSLSASMVCYLSDLYVDPAQRGSANNDRPCAGLRKGQRPVCRQLAHARIQLRWPEALRYLSVQDGFHSLSRSGLRGGARFLELSRRSSSTPCCVIAKNIGSILRAAHAPSRNGPAI